MIEFSRFPAPAAQNWRAVAVAMSKGIADLHPVKRWSIGIGAGFVKDRLRTGFAMKQLLKC